MAKRQPQFTHYYELYRDKIFNYFYYRVDFNRDLAEDLCSDVFLRALDNFESYEPERPFQAWIYRIAHNRLANHYRGLGREIALEEADGPDSGTARAVEADIDSRRLVEEIRGLDDYCREVLLLKYVDQLETAEIARLLDKDEGAVRTQLHRALSKIRNRISQKYGQA